MLISKKDAKSLTTAIAKRLKERTETTIRKGTPESNGHGHVNAGKTNVMLTKYLRGAITGEWDNAPEEHRIFKALGSNKPTQGGFLVPDEVADDVIGRLKDEAVIRNMPGVKTVDIGRKTRFNYVSSSPKITYGSESEDLGEDENFRIGQRSMDISKAKCLVKFSRELLEDSPAAEELLRTELAEEMGLDEDQKILEGKGGTEPLGLYYNPLLTWTNLSGVPDCDDILEAIYELRANNSKPNGIVLNPREVHTLRTLKDAEGRPILQSVKDSLQGDVLYGLPARDTTQISTDFGTGSDESYMIVANWNDLIIGEPKGMRIESTTQGGDAFKNDQVHLKIVRRWGMLLRHDESFALMKGIKS